MTDRVNTAHLRSLPKISIITAVRNCRWGIEATIDSVRSQDDVSVQHIMIDGNSTDGTEEVLREWHRQGGGVWVAEPDQGVYDAFNKGCRLAEGELIGFLNAGDIYAGPRVLADVWQAYQQHSAQVVYGDVDMTQRGSYEVIVRRYGARDFEPERLLRGLMPPHPATFIRRDIFEEIGEYDASLDIAGDFDWAIRFFLKARGEGVYLPKTLVKMPAGGISNRGLMSVLRNTTEMQTVLLKHGLPASWWTLLGRVPRKWLGT